MSTLKNESPSIQKIHLIGICGTAMGSVAGMLHDLGYQVTGSDERVYPPMSTFLEHKGIRIMNGYQPSNLDHRPDLIVVGNAISRGNPELEHALDQRLSYMSLPETLKHFFLRSSHNLVVTGTHGKTTTTSLLAWLFHDAGKAPSFMIGGIPLNFQQGCQKQSGAHWILEGDEYDTAFFDKRSKFIHYLPELVIINNVEFDHADIYANLDEIKKSFRHLVGIVPRNGMIVLNADDPNALDVTRQAHAQLLEVGFSENAAIRITDLQAGPDGTSFTLLNTRFTVPLYGRHNVHNTAMTLVAAHSYQIPLQQLQKSLPAFRGIKRRMEVRGEKAGITVVDDFGHHPTALTETIAAFRQRYPGRRLWALFEPRSNTTRRAIFQKELPEALAQADGVLISAIARAEQLDPHDRLNVDQVVEDIRKKGRPAWHEADANALIERLLPELKSGDVVAVFSNGGFDGLIEKLLGRIDS
ncbi:MAG: UDP-N-acetylmuramate:L-alanyl-gamma-D-glutamyl-meso-diaminopimelate ligase [Blastochloris sp.]|nr:UDP-N-acetylmuramate:L-alanyl-gamma-D-glutamyl-meso-diaminopimelate ligase [Blastochloris sp.]